jgi:hypothetical protein
MGKKRAPEALKEFNKFFDKAAPKSTRKIVKSAVPDELSLFTDFKTYCQEFLWIRNKRGQLVPFIFTTPQNKLSERLDYETKRGNTRRLILKYRRPGITTLMQAKSFFLTANNENMQAATLAHDNQSTAKIFEIALLYYNKLIQWARPLRSTENKKELNFKGLGSIFYIGTAGAQAFGRGQTLQRVHGSEVAFWPKSTDVASLIAGLLEACSHGEVDLETTANGHGNWFHKTWTAAKNGENEWVPIFLAWNDDPELSIYTTAKYDEMQLTTKEEELIKAYTLKPSQILWRRKKMRELYDPDRGNLIFYQEYPINDVEAFISTGSCFFDAEQIAHRASLIQKPIQYGDLNRLKVWEEPIVYHSYAIGADVGEGVPDGDRTCIVVIDTDTCREVASWTGICSPEDAARKSADLGLLYNKAMIAPEANNYGHSMINTLLNDLCYPHLYQHADYIPVRTESGENKTPKYGWQTNAKTRPILITEFREAVQGGFYQPNDAELFSECMTFIDNGHGKYEHSAGAYDDRIFAHAIVWQARKKQIDLTSFEKFAIDTGHRSIDAQWEV